MPPITHAFISVSDKEGIVEFARELVSANITILSTGGTAKLLKEKQIPALDISTLTGFPEILDGRVKSLHPKIYGAILARGTEDIKVLQEHQIPIIGLVVVNLYPFEKVTQQKDCSLETAIENIDIGGPSLLRAAAKNYHYTTVVTCQEDYSFVLQEIMQQGHTTLATRLDLAKKAFAKVMQYDIAISHFFSFKLSNQASFPEVYPLAMTKKMDLRYGENPHQKAAFYTIESDTHDTTINQAVQWQGKPLSYNNIADADAAFECVKTFEETACVIVKHANPCGVAVSKNQLEAYLSAFNADPTSAFGGIIAFNSSLELDTATSILNNQFVEVIIATEIVPGVLELIKQKPNIRVLTMGEIPTTIQPSFEYKSVTGGMLIQEKDNLSTLKNLEQVTLRSANEKELNDLLFAWQVVRFVKSNAIVLARDQSTIGIGPGQTSRVFSLKIAAEKATQAGFTLKGSVLASDAFFPFKDSIEEAAAYGISAIIQPGGSIKDQEVIAAANEHNIAMMFTHTRHFKH